MQGESAWVPSWVLQKEGWPLRDGWAQGAGRRAGPPLLSITTRDRGGPVCLPHPTAHPLRGAASPWVSLAATKGFYCLSLSVSPLQVPPRAARIATAVSTELEPLGLQGKLQSQRVYPTLVSIPLLPDSSISPWDNNAKSFTFPKRWTHTSCWACIISL